MVKVSLGAVFALVTSGAAVAQDTVTWQENIQGWNVAIDRTIENSCFIISGFEDNLFLRFQFNATQKNVQFIVASTDWKSVQSGQFYDVEVAFGGLESWTGQAEGYRWKDILPSLVLSVPVEDKQASNFMKEFTNMGSVRVTHAGAELANLALSGASEAVASMLECQASMLTVEDSKGDASIQLPDGGDQI